MDDADRVIAAFKDTLALDQWTTINIRSLAELLGLDTIDLDPVAVTATARARVERLEDENERLVSEVRRAIEAIEKGRKPDAAARILREALR